MSAFGLQQRRQRAQRIALEAVCAVEDAKGPWLQAAAGSGKSLVARLAVEETCTELLSRRRSSGFWACACATLENGRDLRGNGECILALG